MGMALGYVLIEGLSVIDQTEAMKPTDNYHPPGQATKSYFSLCGLSQEESMTLDCALESLSKQQYHGTQTIGALYVKNNSGNYKPAYYPAGQMSTFEVKNILKSGSTSSWDAFRTVNGLSGIVSLAIQKNDILCLIARFQHLFLVVRQVQKGIGFVVIGWEIALVGMENIE